MEELIGHRATKLLIFWWKYQGQTRLHLQTKRQRWSPEVGLMACVWRPLDPYDKVMKERRMVGVQPGRARGPPCLTNTLCARWSDESRIQKKTVSGRDAYSRRLHKRRRSAIQKGNMRPPSCVELVSRMQPALAKCTAVFKLLINAFLFT